MNKTYAILGLIILIVVGGFIIFGKDKDMVNLEDNTNNPSETNTNINTNTTTVDTNTSVDEDKTFVLDYGQLGFSPMTVTIDEGDSVSFKNDTSGLMWVASDPHPTHTEFSAFDAKKGYSTGEIYTFKFEKAGTYEFHDHLHPTMKGTVFVLADK